MNGWWTITADFISDSDAKEGTNGNARTLCGPRENDLTMGLVVRHPAAQEFQMCDDDDTICYEGYCILPEGIGEEAFGPLDDFGMPNAGCTCIKYRNARGVFECL